MGWGTGEGQRDGSHVYIGQRSLDCGVNFLFSIWFLTRLIYQIPLCYGLRGKGVRRMGMGLASCGR